MVVSSQLVCTAVILGHTSILLTFLSRPNLGNSYESLKSIIRTLFSSTFMMGWQLRLQFSRIIYWAHWLSQSHIDIYMLICGSNIFSRSMALYFVVELFCTNPWTIPKKLHFLKFENCSGKLATFSILCLIVRGSFIFHPISWPKNNT